MKIKHTFDSLSVEKEVSEDAGFMLTNKNGSYIFLRNIPASRYEGLFMFDGTNMYKTVESINILDRGHPEAMENKFYCVERRFSNANEKFFMPRNFTSLVYELDETKEVEVTLDFKDSYDNKEFGRHYDVFWENNCIIARFTKRTDRREDPTSGMEQYTLYLAVRCDAGMQDYKLIEKWAQRHYSFDEKRNSRPYLRHVFDAFSIKGKKFVFSMAAEKSKAVNESSYIFNNLDKIRENEKNAFYESFSRDKVANILKKRNLSNEIKLAYVSALNSLDGLMVKYGNFGILAGLPWFFQIWSRDEAISMKALENIDKEFAKNLVLDRIGKMQENGRLPKIYYCDSQDTNADAVGWLFLRAFGFHKKAKHNLEALEHIKASILKLKGKRIKQKKIIEVIEKLEKSLAAKQKSNKCLVSKAECVNQSISAIARNYFQKGLVYNSNKETWMDTMPNSDGRAGFNIEIQALMLAIMKYASEITANKEYKKSESELKANVLNKFWNGSFLADNLANRVIRPNVFLAHYAYPELLNAKEWEKCFDICLNALWLGFGFSTIDKKNPLFVKRHTGEQEQSYHNGDSWFWINNIAAMAMLNANSKKYKDYAEKIIKASTEDILWHGVIGSHSELSSAESLSSEGCLNQAWSNAMYIELVDNISKKN